MSSETIVSALFLISAVVAAGVLINSVFPIISRTTETFGSVSHSTDTQMRTDFKVVNTYANSTNVIIWLKNVGSSRISSTDLDQSDVFVGSTGNFERLPLSGHYQILEGANGFWDPGATLSVTLTSTRIPPSGETGYFAIVLPNGVKRSVEFTVS